MADNKLTLAPTDACQQCGVAVCPCCGKSQQAERVIYQPVYAPMPQVQPTPWWEAPGWWQAPTTQAPRIALPLKVMC